MGLLIGVVLMVLRVIRVFLVVALMVLEVLVRTLFGKWLCSSDLGGQTGSGPPP